MIELFFLLLILSFSSSSIESALVCGGIFALFNSRDTARTQHRKKKTEPRNELDRLYFFYFKWDNLYFSIWTSKRKIKWFIRKHEKIDGNSNDNDQLDDTFCQCYNNTSSPVQPRRARARWDTVSQSLRSVASDLMSRCLKNCGIRLMTTPRERMVREIFMFSILSRLVWPIVRCQSTTCTRKEEKQKTWRREAERKTVFFFSYFYWDMSWHITGRVWNSPLSSGPILFEAGHHRHTMELLWLELLNFNNDAIFARRLIQLEIRYSVWENWQKWSSSPCVVRTSLSCRFCTLFVRVEAALLWLRFISLRRREAGVWDEQLHDAREPLNLEAEHYAKKMCV